MKAKNIEVEQKYRLSSPQQIRKVLKNIGARKIASGMENNELFDRTGELAHKNCVLRLRKHGSKSTLTFKGPRLKSKYKKRVEIETAVDFKRMKIVLEQLGYRKVLVYRKTREEYRYGKAHITLDYLSRIGWFCEIEASPATIKKLENQLGFSRKDVEDRTYLEILGKRS